MHDVSMIDFVEGLGKVIQWEECQWDPYMNTRYTRQDLYMNLYILCLDFFIIYIYRNTHTHL